MHTLLVQSMTDEIVLTSKSNNASICFCNTGSVFNI